METKKVNEILAIMKGLAISMIVIYHSGCTKLMFNFLSLFHLAIFYFSMGYFFKNEYLEKPFGFVKRKFCGLYLVFVKWQVAFILFHNLFERLYLNEDRYSLYEMVRRCFAVCKLVRSEVLLLPFWYIISAIMCVMLYFVMRYIVYKLKIKRDIAVLALMIVCSFLFGVFLIERGISTGYYIESSFIIVYILFVGDICRRYETYINENGYIAFLCLFILLVFSSVRGFNFMHQDFWSYWQFLIVTPLGIYLIYYMAKMIKKNSVLKTIFVMLGTNSLYILALHNTVFKLVSFLKILVYDDLCMNKYIDYTIVYEKNNFLWCCAYTIVGIAVPLVIMYFVEGIKRKSLRLINNLFSLHKK